jgi:hypothetical protein
LLFGEDGARAVVSCPPAAAAGLLALAAERGVPALKAGLVRAPEGRLELRAGGRLLGWDTKALRRVYFEAIPRRMAHANLDR